MAWFKGSIKADVPSDLANTESDSVPLRSSESRWPTPKAFSVEIEVQRQNHQSADLNGCPKLSPGHLFTRTQWSALYIKHDGQREHYRGSGIPPNGNLIIRTANSREHSKAIGALLGTVEYRSRGTLRSREAVKVDFIALGVGVVPWYVEYRIDQDILEKNCFHVGQPRDGIQPGQPGVAVMAVKWSGPIARRLALGWVALQGWMDSQPEFRTIVLA